MKKKRRRGRCAKCKKSKLMTRHHFLPKQFYGENNSIVSLCRDCHDRVEKLIPKRRMSKQFYRRLIYNFLNGGA